jgi:hypothetical protein
MPWYKQSGAFQRRAAVNHHFDGPLLAVTANCRCSRRAKARSSARNYPESGECRMTPLSASETFQRNVSRMNVEDIEKYDGLGTEALMEMLGAELRKSRVGLLHGQELRAAGEKAYNTYKAKLKSVICSNVNITHFISDERLYQRVQIISAISDCISGYLTGVTLCVVSVMLAREGLSSYCQGSQDE